MPATNTALLENSLTVGSKKRLADKRRRLETDRDGRLFDRQVCELLMSESRNPQFVKQQVDRLFHLKDEDGVPFSQSYYDSKKMAMNIEAFALPNHTSFRWNRWYQKSLEELINEFSQFKLDVLSYTSDDSIIDAIPKLTTHSGWSYIQCGKRTKGEYMDGIFSTYLNEQGKAIKNGTFGKPIYPADRTQGKDYLDGTCSHKTRLVSAVDLYVILAELKWAKPFQECIGGKLWYAGGKEPGSIRAIIHGMQGRFTHYVSLDYSGFDASISSWLIQDAFRVVKAAFKPLNSEDQSLFDVIVHDFINKDFISKDGFIHSSKGVPSGSMFTQIIDSIVNRLMINTYLNMMGVSGQMMIMGDDNILYTQGAIDLTHLETYLNKNFGVKVNASKSSQGLSTSYPEFLSREWRADGEWRDPRILIGKLLYPERVREYHEKRDIILVVYSYIYAYRIGMNELIDVSAFEVKYDLRPSMLENVATEQLPGYLKYLFMTYKKNSSEENLRRSLKAS